MSVKRLWQALVAGALLVLGIVAVPNPANAWSCTTIQTQFMYFEEGTPIHSAPRGSSSVVGILGYEQPLDVNGSCVSDSGLQWWRVDVGAYNGYAYDGYRVG
ncbi:hypothetical protein [Microbispora sp. NPDC046933]|uniref:hypothetical protein n=1 Tax=Microbispora sp. NPDC046933 TaxID=3155618 RepID=UPI0033DAB34A